MKKSTKIIIGVLVGILILAIGLVIANNILEKKIKKGIEDNLDNANAKYEKVDVKLLDRSAEVINAEININGKLLKVDTILLNNIQVIEYIQNKNIIVGNLNIANPVVKIYNLPEKKKDSTSNSKSSGFKNKITIKNVAVNGGSLQIFEKDSSNHRLYTKIRDVKMEEVRINSNTLKETVPFNYDLILLNADSVFYDLNEVQELAVGDFVIRNNEVNIKRFQIIPKYSKAEHQKHIKKELDRYQLTIDSIYMDSFSWSVQNDSLKIQNSLTQIDGFNFQIYRDKLMPDDNSTKPLYSKMLRELPILVKLDSISITGGYLKYEERIHADRKAGVVDFSNMNANISQITNIDLDRENFPKTVIKANADFMTTAPLSVTWQFDISDTSDQFNISGSMGSIGAEEMNKFMKPAMNVEAKGQILDMYFNFAGNDYQASGDMKLEYNDFKIEVLQKDGEKKNKVVSALANLIVKNKAVNNKASYNEISFTRDQSKSFWNYLWNLIKNGALKAFL